MTLTEDELRHFERLARVSIGGESRDKLKAQLAHIISFVQKLQEADITGRDLSCASSEPRLRDDEPEACLGRDEIIAEAPASERGFFQVPAVIETEEP